MNLKKGILLALLSSAILFIASCSKNDDDNPKPQQQLQTVMVKDLPADPHTRDPDTGEPIGGTNKFTFFRFSDSTIVPNSDSASSKWDIGFRGTTIILNSNVSGPGAASGQVVKSTLEALTKAPERDYLSDSTSGNVFADWYDYNMQKHVITPTPGYILVIHTNDGKYVKMEILSYYKGAPASPTSADASGYYTFRYVYQADGSRSFAEEK